MTGRRVFLLGLALSILDVALFWGIDKPLSPVPTQVMTLGVGLKVFQEH